jgi:hypothetical protein
VKFENMVWYVGEVLDFIPLRVGGLHKVYFPCDQTTENQNLCFKQGAMLYSETGQGKAKGGKGKVKGSVVPCLAEDAWKILD